MTFTPAAAGSAEVEPAEAGLAAVVQRLVRDRLQSIFLGRNSALGLQAAVAAAPAAADALFIS